MLLTKYMQPKMAQAQTNESTGTGCQPTDLDVSPAMFNKMANPDLGRVLVTWAWL